MNFRIGRIFFYVLIVVGLYAIRYLSLLPPNSNENLFFYVGKNIDVIGTVTDYVEDFGWTLRSYVKIDTLILKGNYFSVKGDAILMVPSTEILKYGDRVKIRGVLEPQKRSRPDLAGVFKNPQIYTEPGNGNILKRYIYRLKAYLQNKISYTFPYPVSSFAEGILLGARSSIPKSITEDFKRAGLTHILAISGFNIVILIQCFEYIFSYFPRRWAIISTLVGIFVFSILVGAGASVVRASIMGSLTVIAKLFGRKSNGIRALFISAFIMIMADPFILIWDIGFQLSFAATAGILFFAKNWQQKFNFVPGLFGAKDAFIVTTSAQVFTLPILLYYFKSFSIISFAANIFVLPFIPILMLGSFLSLFMGKLIAIPTYWLFELVLTVIHYFAEVPFGFIDFGIS